MVEKDEVRFVYTGRRRDGDVNSGAPWSDIDVIDLKDSLEFGRSLKDVAGFLCRSIAEIQAKARQQGFVVTATQRNPKHKTKPEVGPPKK